MARSILTTTKKSLGLDESYEAFDVDLLMFINAALANMNQLGIGPEAGLTITDKTTTWEQFLGTDPRLNIALEYTYYSVKIAFDPPSSPPALMSLEKLRDEAAWRLSITPEETGIYAVGGTTSITGNLGDEHVIRLSNPNGQELINATGQYEADFTPTNGTARSVPLDISEISIGVLTLPITIANGVYRVRLLSPRRTIASIKVTAV